MGLVPGNGEVRGGEGGGRGGGLCVVNLHFQFTEWIIKYKVGQTTRSWESGLSGSLACGNEKGGWKYCKV